MSPVAFARLIAALLILITGHRTAAHPLDPILLELVEHAAEDRLVLRLSAPVRGTKA